MQQLRKYNAVFWKIRKAAADHPRIISNRGGTRSGKTYATLQFLHELIPVRDKAGDVSSAVSESLPHLKRGAIRDFERIVGHPLAQDAHWNASSNTYTYDNGAKLEFFSVDSPDKVLGPSRKRLFINECNHISFETFRQLAVRTTGVIFLDYNPAEAFWATDKVETRPDCITIHSTYLDNKEFLSAEQVREIEANKGDSNWWKVYGLGEIGSLEGLIYHFNLIPSLPAADGLTEVQGMDFGFTNDPTARVQCLVDHKRKIVYARERCYETHMQNRHIIEDLQADGVGRNVEIYADCAEPKSIADIQEAGYNVIPCDKDAPVKSDKLKFQLQWMQGWELNVTADSLNLINELRNYVWAQDRDGNRQTYPIDKFNHALDALRYAVWTRFGRDAGYGDYVVSFSHTRTRR
jgi:phage terminase large subunit